MYIMRHKFKNAYLYNSHGQKSIDKDADKYDHIWNEDYLKTFSKPKQKNKA